ncbi:hypothetical protein K2Y11_22100 [bacterium]|nr:hypothetical protein [bacterium]
MLSRRETLLAALGAIAVPGPLVYAFDSAEQQRIVDGGQGYLVKMFDRSMNLLPEFSGSKTYWLYHDNYLAAKILEGVDPDKAKWIRERIKSFGIDYSGKIEIVFGEAKDPLPFKQYELFDVAKVGDKIVKSERATDRPLQGWEGYGDLLALAILAEPNSDQAPILFKKLVAMWDGQGIADRAMKQMGIYATYKIALAMLAARKLNEKLPFADRAISRLIRLQHPFGGMITDYDKTGTPNGMANVETTSLVLLALGNR